MPFFILRYNIQHRSDRNRTKVLYTMMGRVDEITAPAMVVPSTINCKSFAERNIEVRSNLYFFNIPFKFLCRDDWADIVRMLQ